MMTIVTPVFLICAIAFHLPFALWWQRRLLSGVDEPTRRAIADTLRARWWIFYVVYAAAFGGVLCWLAFDWTAIVSNQRHGWIPGVALGVFHGVWWPFAMPIFHALDRALREHGVTTEGTPTSPVRTATLKPRRVFEYLPSWSGVSELALLLVGATVLLTRVLTAEIIEPRLAMGAALFAMTGLITIVAYAFWIRMETQQSYSTFSESATEEELESLRRFRIRLVFAGQLLMAGAFLVAAGLFIEVARGTIAEPTAGVIGGVLGSAVGIAGGIAGTMAGLRAAKLQRTKQYCEPQ